MNAIEKQLLVFAAKAAGIQTKFCYEGGMPFANRGDGLWLLWNPLKDDGDALRLATALRLQIKPGKHLGDGCTVETQRDGIAGCTAFYDDKEQQMRQAIVQAAAEIGRSMP